MVADPTRLPFKSDSFDFALISGLIEYLPKATGELVIQESNKVAMGTIVKVPSSGSPIDFAHTIFDSIWCANDFRMKGYGTFTVGFKQRNLPCTLFAYQIKNHLNS